MDFVPLDTVITRYKYDRLIRRFEKECYRELHDYISPIDWMQKSFRQQLFWEWAGRLFGYPVCCIKFFRWYMMANPAVHKIWLREYRKIPPWKRIEGYIPCNSCLVNLQRGGWITLIDRRVPEDYY